ncbi:vacuolar-type H+-ATPase subunit E/Vma4 [Kribbella aluminosa]|uniref:Vacuolar-type H+-ATPase subunit E/Vma4 n=1 Tax=Kribbella aluminosa TaxID=416017 RepID=A0ABS4UQ74_9ACTN|nr:hypothetical protein [Kribbella aluminosa]MBP2353726.1 vacuolar-type H+-ATPase subunit E/Vma4 [Kribbella aluminosa]
MSPESDYQRRARLEREARKKAQAKQRARETQALDRAETIAREKTAPEQHQHLAEARRRIEEREGRIGRELGRALEDRIKNGPNQLGKGSVQRLVGLGSRVFGDGRTAIDLAQSMISYGRQLDEVWKAFGSYTPPQPVKETRAQERERAQREREQRDREAREQNIEQVRYLMGVTYGDASPFGKLTPEQVREYEAQTRSRVRDSREFGSRERGRGGRGD